MSETESGSAGPSTTTGEIEAALSAADLEWRAVGADDDAFTVAGVRPAYVCAPASVDEVAATVKAASAAGRAVIPRGAGTRMSLGFPPRAADLVLQTTGLNEIVEYEPADLTVTVQAGMTLGAIQERLRAEGQMLALDPPAAETATIGGLIAANASGPLRLMYGTARDIVIGTRVVNADGIVSKAGGRVVKNVAGYDLNKLYVGSLGTVGVIVELSFKLHPLPANEGMVVAAFKTAADAAKPIAALMRSPLGPAAIEVLDAGAAASLPDGLAVDGDGVVLVVSAQGFEKAIQRQLRDIQALCDQATGVQSIREGETLTSVWAALRSYSDPSAADLALLKLAVPPARGTVALATAHTAAQEAGFMPQTGAHAGSGVVYLRLQPDTWTTGALANLAALVTRLRGFARGEGGSLVLEACPLAALQGEAGIDPWGDAGSGFPVMRSLKENLDPKGTLNPGRFVGRL
ncbi:MAG: FAD-binding oxidoreductase [Chloroflexi bacterium]|nr:FAD-binding oxidoreductase [Chloroflexota bacterium]